MVDETDNVEASATENPLRKLHGKVIGDIRSRQEWLSKQSHWYQMRHDGVRRKNKPWPGAADLHFPLVDSIIDKLKPFYFNQIFATETVAQFVAQDDALQVFAGEMAGWFDWKLKQASNLEREILVAIDKMLMAGQTPVKVYWDAARKRVAFDALEPQHCIVPDSTQDLETADRVTLVHQLSCEQYERDPRFTRKEPDFVKRLCGKGDAQDGRDQELEEKRKLREGITHSEGQCEMVIVWEIWEHTAEGWLVHWISPMAPDEALRPSQRNPYKHGKLPLVRFECEVKDKGHYSSRGVPEKSGAFEAVLNKQWNEKSDYMTLCNRPLFTSTQPIPNAGNLRLTPGQIVQGGLQAVQMPNPPVSFDQEMVGTRMTAEYHIGMPDFGTGQAINTSERRTATEVDRTSSIMGVGVQLRGRTFRMSLGELLQLAYSILLQYDGETQFFADGQAKRLNEQALREDAWHLEPSGSSESWNKAEQLQRAIARKQLFAQSPWIDQAELDKSILELDDARLVKRLFRDPQLKQASEYEAEATIIPTLMLGLPLPATPEQDQQARIKCILDFLAQRGKLGAPVDPVAMQGIKGRMDAHLEQLGQKDPQAARQIAQQIQQISVAHAQGAIPAGNASPAVPMPENPALSGGGVQA